MRKYRNIIITTMITFIMIINSVTIYGKDITTEEASQKIKVMMDFIMENYVGEEIDEEKLMQAALKGMFNELDEYSEFYTPEEYLDFTQSLSGSFGGIGVEINQDVDYIKVIRPLPQTPGEKAGLLEGDLILAVDGVDIKGYTASEAANIIRGEIGTPVILTILRGDNQFDVEIIRDNIRLISVQSQPIREKIEDLKSLESYFIWYVEITKFNKNVSNEFKQVLKEAKNKNIEGLVIDLRNNPGGYMDEVISICNEIIPAGPIVHTVNKSGEKVTKYSTLKEAPFEIVVLVNQYSASASEILAGAVKDSGVGVLVGEKTFGKGIVQHAYNGENGMMFKLTMEEYLTRNENHIHGKGIEPNYKVTIPAYISGNTSRLKKGDTGVLVNQIEEILAFLGYDIGVPDKVYDIKTEEAIRTFQNDVGLYSYGVCDYETQSKLNEKIMEYIKEKDPQLVKGVEVLEELIKKSLDETVEQ